MLAPKYLCTVPPYTGTKPSHLIPIPTHHHLLPPFLPLPLYAVYVSPILTSQALEPTLFPYKLTPCPTYAYFGGRSGRSK